ncbi:MAG: metal ABC transporter permease [Planctomycetaceae bacterium]|nr:metal ABC transporter permease [Planctomycetaceae bacterium]
MATRVVGVLLVLMGVGSLVPRNVEAARRSGVGVRVSSISLSSLRHPNVETGHPHILAIQQNNTVSPSLVSRLSRVLSLRDYNTRVVLLGTTILGITAGIVGTFMLLRKRALVGDVVGHSALPGIAIAFLVMEGLSPGTGKWLPGLLLGAFAFGLAGAVTVMLIDKFSRIKADAAMAMTLSVFYGLGAALFTIVQRVPGGNAAGLKTYLNGKTASLVADDVWLFVGIATVVLVLAMLFMKELTILCFDEQFAAAEGWPVFWLDTLLIGLVVTVTIVGMQSVGLILVVATLIIPPASARFWTDDIRLMTLGAGLVGGMSSFFGTVISALFPRMAAGAVIVLTGASLFALSLLFGSKRGVLVHAWQQRKLRHDVGRVDLLRACFELVEHAVSDPIPTHEEMMDHEILLGDLVSMRAWDLSTLRRLVAVAEKDGLMQHTGDDNWRLTETGAEEARRIARNHRLWEMYLMQYAHIAPSHVDRDADLIEHVLDPELIAELEYQLDHPEEAVPVSSHATTGSSSG